MKKKLRLLIFILFSFISLTHAALQINLGDAVKTGNYYTYPDLRVTGNEGDKVYVIRIMFTRPTASGDQITLVDFPKSSWKANANSTQFVRMINIPGGTTASEVESYLRTVRFSFDSDKKGQAVLILLHGNSKEDASRRMYYSSANGHWYEYVADNKITWNNAYNDALDKQFMGMTGYLATITNAVENSFIHTVTSGASGWISGTRKDIRNALKNGKLEKKWFTFPNINQLVQLNYWYWSAGPEWEDNGENPVECAFYNRATHDGSEGISDSDLTYHYNNWNAGEPNSAEGEYYAHILESGLWDDHDYNDNRIKGYLVEYKGTFIGTESHGTIGFESSKSASPGENGTVENPVGFVYGDEVKYTITAANTSDVNTTVTIVDKVPDGLEIVDLGGGNFNSANREITWTTDIPTEGTGTVSFKVKKSKNATGDMTNTAYVTSGGITQQTNSTYHKGLMCNVTFKSGDGGVVNNGATQAIDYGLSPNIGVTVMEKAGYSFAGWSYPSYITLKGGAELAANGIMDYTSIKVLGNMYLTADFNLIPYTITYVMNGANEIPPQKYYVNSLEITLPTPDRGGYDFVGWTGTELIDTTRNFTIPKKNFAIPTGSTGNRTYTANWDIIPYTITYNNVPADIENNNLTGYDVETPTFNITELRKAGYEFRGWTGEGITTPQLSVSIPTGSMGDKTYTANWDTIDYNITYKDSITPVTPLGAPATYRDTDLPKEIKATLSKPGRTFIGWSGGAGANNTPTITIPEGTHADQTYQAIWSVNDYTITFDANGGVNPTISTKWLGYNVDSLPINNISITPTRTGYTFEGWSGHGLTDKKSPFSITNATPGVPGNLTYTANWTLIDYIIRYDTDGGSPINSQKYNVNSAPITLPTPTYEGYTFLGWTSEEFTTPRISVTIPSHSTGDRTYKANWQIDTYNITYDHDGGIPPVTENPETYTVLSPTFTLSPPTRPGWTFAGWTETGGECDPEAPEGTSVTINTGSITGHIAYKANWTPVTYTITYNLNGGIPPAPANPDSYDVTLTPFPIEHQPEKPGYTFVGWTGSNGTIPQLVINVPDTATGNLTYDAQWSFRFALDTVVSCSAPFKLEGGNDGLDYVWILPDGSSRTTPSIEAMHSGNYVLYTNYGTMETVDTVYALIFFDENQKIDYSLTGSINVGSTVNFYASLSKYLQDVTCQWNIQGATPSTFTGDTARVVFTSSGKKTVSVAITATKDGLTCSKVLDLELMVFSSRNGYFVDQNVTGGEIDGTSWANAYRTIQDALAHAGMNDYIWVAKGSYSPDQDAAFVVHNDSIRIIGGFAGWETQLSERDFAKNQTILKGNGKSVIINTDANGILWDGFIIEGGNASSGGGIYNNKSSAIVANSIIRNNTAERGGGIYSRQSTPVLYNVVMSGNTAQEGGAMYNDLSNPLTINVTVSGNRAATAGGIYNNSSHPQHRNTIIWGNRADKDPDIYNNSSTPGYYYSLVEGSNGSQDWNVLFGTDGGHNLDGNPFFKKNGFDNSGKMIAGDYELYAASRVVDKGNKSFIYDIKTISDIHLSSLAGIQYTSLPFDLKGNERIFNDKVDMGAYEYGASQIIPGINRFVRLPSVEGLTTDPEAGEHSVKSHEDFVFTVTAKPGYSLDYLDVKTGIPIRDKEGIRMVRNEDGSVTVTILQVTETLNITINGVNPVSNNEIDHGKVWAYGNKLYIKTAQEAEVRIYTISGNLYVQQRIKEPETVIVLAPGVYTVIVDNDTYKVLIKE